MNTAIRHPHYPKWLIGLCIALLVAILAGLGYWGYQKYHQQHAARTSLNQMLGDTAYAAPFISPDFAPRQFDKINQDMERLRNDFDSAIFKDRIVPGYPLEWTLSYQTPSVNITENKNAYEIRVPLNRAEDAKQVNVDVKPHHIAVSGTLSSKSTKGHNEAVVTSSQFMKSFTTNAEVDPTRINQAVQDKTLVVTIPKKNSEQTSSSNKG